jgi:diguanylate cyclase (GGDEF)-like protein
MTSLTASSSAKPSGPARRLILPFALIVVGAFALCAVLGFALAHQSDIRHQQQQRASVVGVIDEFRSVFAEFAELRASELSVAISSGGAISPADVTVRLLRPDHQRGHDAAYVVSADGRMIAAIPAGANELPAELARLAGSDGRRGSEAAANRANGVGAVRTDFVSIGERPALAAVAEIPPAPNSRLSVAAPAILVTVALLEPHLTGVLEKTSAVTALRFDSEPNQRDRDELSLIDQHGRIVGWVGWRAQNPMLGAVIRLLPLLALLGACFAGFAALALRHVRSSTRDLAASQAAAHRIANEDPLTGLPNRREILEALDRLLIERHENKVVCFAFLDVDGFKDVNEALGHQAGDELLISIAQRLRAATAGSGILGRLGGDEFAVVVQVADAAAAVHTANAAIRAMIQPFWISGQALQVGLSVGLAQAPLHGESRDELTRRADLALRAAKRHARGRTIAFQPDMEEELQDRRFVTRELRRALAEGGLDVHYQPIVAADGQRIVGVEALLRWKHPTRGDIPPTTFVPVAEQTGLMPKLGEFVLRRALNDALRWNDVYIAVNLSPVQVRDRNLVDLIANVIKQTGIAPERVVMEVTEGVLIDNPNEARERLESLRALGVKVALDDFGSGYSSLSYLRRFPIDKLKIDREFVTPLGRSANGGVIIQAIIALGRALGLTVLCEGVETEEQRILLRLAGCDEMQGFLFARPGPPQNIDRLIAQGADGTDAVRMRRVAVSDA